MQNFESNTTGKNPELKETIKILGNHNRSKGKREAYDIKVFDSQTKGTFWYSSTDHKFNSAKKDIVCKVLKILQTYYFDTKRLTAEYLAQLLGKFDINYEILKDKN